MTTPAATIPLTYDAVDLQDADFGIFLEITQGLNDTPEVRGRDVTVPGLDGQIARNRKSHEMKLVLTGQVMGNGATEALRRSDYRTQVKFLRVLFSPKRQPALLRAPLEDGTIQSISARPLNSIWNEVVASEFAYLSVELVSVDPDWVPATQTLTPSPVATATAVPVPTVTVT